MGISAAIVPQLVPMASEIRQEMRKKPASMRLEGMSA